MTRITSIVKKLTSQHVAKQRRLKRGYNLLAYAMAVGAALLHLYSVYHGLFNPRMQRSLHLMFMLPLAFILFPARERSPKERPSVPDMIMAVLAVVVCSLGTLELERLENRWIFATDLFPREILFGHLRDSVRAVRRVYSIC